MGRRRRFPPSPPDDAEHIVGPGIEFKPEHDLVNAGQPLPTPVEFIRFGATVDEFHRHRETELAAGRKLLLMEGELVETPRATPGHNIALLLADYLFKAVFAKGYVVCIQMGMVFNINTDPIPDLAVVPGDPRSLVAMPSTAALVLEVSDTTFAFDTGEKASLYAAAGIADYWVVDVTGSRVLVYRSPAPDPKQKDGHGYTSVTVLLPGQSLAPLAAPQAPVGASDLLP